MKSEHGTYVMTAHIYSKIFPLDLTMDKLPKPQNAGCAWVVNCSDSGKYASRQAPSRASSKSCRPSLLEKAMQGGCSVLL